MASEFSSTVSPPRTELGLGTMPSTQLLATASMSNYAAERKYAQAHPTWHKPQIMHCPKPSGLPESRGVQVSACSGVHVPLLCMQATGLDVKGSPPRRPSRRRATVGGKRLCNGCLARPQPFTCRPARASQNTMDREYEGPLPTGEAWAGDAYASPREKLRRRLPDPKTEQLQRTRSDYFLQQMTLHYLAYYVEDVRGSALETQRARIVRFDYFVEDDTLRVYEPREDNSGLDQGMHLKRHKAFTDDGQRVTPLIITIGSQLTLFGTTYTIVDADARTRAFALRQLGLELGERQPIPPRYVHPPTKRLHCVRPTTVVYDVGYKENPTLGFYSRAGDTRGQFQDHAGEVLRFEAEWTDAAAGGDTHTLLLHYYLADDTLELIEPPYHNSGRGPFVKVLARQRLPRVAVAAAPTPAPTGAARLGFQSPEEASAGVSAELEAKRMQQRYRFSRGADWRYHHSSPITGKPMYTSPGGVPATPPPPGTASYITAADLVCGRTLTVYGKPLLLRRADPWTVQWFRQQLGVDQTQHFVTAPRGSTALPGQRVQPGLGCATTPPPVPPHVGATAIGDEVETRHNAHKLIPTPLPGKDVEQLYKQAGKVMRFHARLVTEHPIASQRRFVMSYYLEDDTLQVFETAAPNSGLTTGKFLDRGAYRVLEGDDAAAEAASTTKLARERRFGTVGYLLGYEHGYGQGYAGGSLGKEDRVGPGGTGVALARGVGVHTDTVTTLAATAAQGHPIRSHHLRRGAKLTFAHAPAQTFELLEPDAFTAHLLTDMGVEGYEVPGGDEASAAADEACDEALPQAQEALLALLSGCMASARTVCRQADYGSTGALHPAAVRTALRRYGVAPPAVPAGDLDTVLAAHTITLQQAADRSLPAECVGLVDYAGLFDALKARQATLQAQAARSDTKLLGQLRYALLSSRTHLREVFRNLGLAVPGCITPAEFRRMLRRHNLDLGMGERELLEAMAHYPPAPVEAAAQEGSISLRGFIERLVDAHGLGPAEVEDFVSLVTGTRRSPREGAAAGPPVFNPVNRQPLWAESGAKKEAPGSPFPPPVPVVEEAQPPLDTSVEEGAAAGGNPDTAGASTPSRSTATPRVTPREEEGPSPAKDPGASSGAAELFGRLGDFFQYRRSDLHRTMALYDPGCTGSISITSLIAALESAGFSLLPSEESTLRRVLQPATDKVGKLSYGDFLLQLLAAP